MDEELINALIKRAKGYSFSEVQEEYSVTDGGEITLTKRKVSEKYCPPDAAALKTYMEICKDKDISEMSDEELEREKHRLLCELYREEQEKEDKEKLENLSVDFLDDNVGVRAARGQSENETGNAKKTEREKQQEKLNKIRR